MDNRLKANDTTTPNKRPRWGNHYSSLKVDRVISILVLTFDIEQASEATGINKRTINRWLKEDEEFKEKLRLAKREVFESGYALLRQEFTKTVHALIALRDNVNVSDAVRLGAMRTLMEYGRQVDMTDHYDGKLEQLEAKTINADSSPITDTTNGNWIDNTPDWKDQTQDQTQDWPKWEQ